jgi:putative Holliday junction resolvase
MTGVVTVLGFDVGARRIGVAVGNSVSMSASEVGVLDMLEGGPDWPRLDRWLREWRPDTLVVGDPINDGADQTSRKRARRFARDLAARYALAVEQVDERNTSLDAAQRFAEGRRAGARKRHQAASLDALAAVIIVERWLAEPQARTRPGDPDPDPSASLEPQ